MLYTTKSMVLYVGSLNIILTSIVLWLQSLSHALSDLLSIGVSIAGLIMTYYTVIHLREKIRGQRLDNLIKELEIKDKAND